jgi:hypothetical protein
MVRLDRKEYKCTHCGAITVVSDDDADRLEQLLTNVLNRPAASPTYGTRQMPNASTTWTGLGIAGFILVLAIGSSILFPGRRHTHSADVSETGDSGVPPSQVVVSSLEWKPDSLNDGSYIGTIYNHSGYPIEVPNYTLTLFHDGMKDDSSFFASPIQTLLPGEYEPIKFSVPFAKPNARYELEVPEKISRSQRELVSLPLQQIQFVHRAGDDGYSLIGVVTNTFKKPITGAGELFLYGKDQQLIATATTSFTEIRPGEKTIVSMDAYPTTKDAPISAYEYMIDAYYSGYR